MRYDKFLITGCSGFIGNSILEFLNNNGYNVIGLTVDDYINPNFNIKKINFSSYCIAECINEFQPDIIIHAAGTSSVGISMTDPVHDFNNSVKILLDVMEGIRISRYRPMLVYPSSASVYGNPARLPIKENDLLRPISPYGYHKLLCEKIAEEYSNLFSIPVLIIRLFSVFGPYQKKLLIWELFNKFLTEGEVVLQGTGDETRDYLYIDDLTNSLLKIICALKENFTVLNLASGKAISVKDLVNKISSILRDNKTIIYQNKIRNGDPSHWRADISNLENIIGYPLETNFDIALKVCLNKWLVDSK